MTDELPGGPDPPARSERCRSAREALHGRPEKLSGGQRKRIRSRYLGKPDCRQRRRDGDAGSADGSGERFMRVLAAAGSTSFIDTAHGETALAISKT